MLDRRSPPTVFSGLISLGRSNSMQVYSFFPLPCGSEQDCVNFGDQKLIFLCEFRAIFIVISVLHVLPVFPKTNILRAFYLLSSIIVQGFFRQNIRKSDFQVRPRNLDIYSQPLVTCHDFEFDETV